MAVSLYRHQSKDWFRNVIGEITVFFFFFKYGAIIFLPTLLWTVPLALKSLEEQSCVKSISAVRGSFFCVLSCFASSFSYIADRKVMSLLHVFINTIVNKSFGFFCPVQMSVKQISYCQASYSIKNPLYLEDWLQALNIKNLALSGPHLSFSPVQRHPSH